MSALALMFQVGYLIEHVVEGIYGLFFEAFYYYFTEIEGVFVGGGFCHLIHDGDLYILEH